MPSRYEWSILNLNGEVSDPTNTNLLFKKINPTTYESSSYTTQTNTDYKINSHNDIIYTDISSIHASDSSFTIEFTMSEIYSSTDKEINYLTFGHHIRGKSNVCITVGRPKDSNCVVIGTISEDESIKYPPAPFLTGGYTVTGQIYTYTLVYNHIGIGANKLRLFRKITDQISDPILICQSPEDDSTTTISENIIDQSRSEYSIVDRKLFLGTSMWTAGLGWDSYFDVAVITVYSLVFNSQTVIDPTFTTTSDEYPTNIILTNTTDADRNTNRIAFDNDFIEIKFNSSRRVNSNNVYLIIQDIRFPSSGTPTETETGLEYTFVFQITSIFPNYTGTTHVLSFYIDFNGTHTLVFTPDIINNIFIKHGRSTNVRYTLTFTDLVYNNLLANTYMLTNFIDSIKTAFSLTAGTTVTDTTVAVTGIRRIQIGTIRVNLYPGSVIAQVTIDVGDLNMANLFISETTSVQDSFREILQDYGVMIMPTPTIGETEADPGMDIDFTIESVTATTVVLKIKNITNQYFEMVNIEKYTTSSTISRLKVEFIAENTEGVQITITPLLTSPNTLHTIEGLTPLDSVWTITAVLTDEEDITTVTAIPTANTQIYDGFLEKIRNYDSYSPELSNSFVMTNHNSGDTSVVISEIYSKDIHSKFITYAGMFDSNQPVTQDIFDMELVGAVIKFEFDALGLEFGPTVGWISLGGEFTKVIKKVGSNYAVHDIEYNRDYYVFVFSIDDSFNKNTNTTFLDSPFATVRVNSRYNDYDMGLPIIPDLFLRSTFSAPVGGDTISGDYVGYDLSGNNSHVYIEVSVVTNEPVLSDGSLDVSLIDILYINYFDVFSTKFTFSIDFSAKLWTNAITLLGSDDDAAFIQVTETTVRITTTNDFSVTFDTDTTKLVDVWYNLVVMYDLVNFHAYIDGVKLVTSLTPSSGIYSPQNTRFVIKKQDVFVNNIQIYTKYDPSIVQKILTSSEKTVELGYDTQGTVVYNLASGSNPTYEVKPKYSTDAAVNNFSMNFEKSDNSSLTIPNNLVYTDMTISSWVKIDSYPETHYPIVSFEDGSLEFGIDSSGYIYFETN
jgi:hypothetical protein